MMNHLSFNKLNISNEKAVINPAKDQSRPFVLHENLCF